MGEQKFYFINYYNSKVTYWITEKLDGTEYYVVRGEISDIQLETFLDEERDHIIKDVTETRQNIISALATQDKTAAIEGENKK